MPSAIDALDSIMNAWLAGEPRFMELPIDAEKDVYFRSGKGLFQFNPPLDKAINSVLVYLSSCDGSLQADAHFIPLPASNQGLSCCFIFFSFV